MQSRKLRDLTVSPIGLGCMGFSQSFGALPPEEEGIALIRKAIEMGCNFLDTSEAYGPYTNEILVGKAIKPCREKVVLATKVHPAIFPGQEHFTTKISREAIRASLEASLKRLQTDYVDLYYLHRIPEGTNMAEVAVWFGELIKEGKIKGWGVSEATAEQIRAAHAVTPLTAVQNEYSMMERKNEPEVIPTCKELGIGFVAFAPLAEGFLSGKYPASSEYKGFDIRRAITRFKPENVTLNQPVIDLLWKYANLKKCTPAQVALAWTLRHENVVPICGMRKVERLEENLGGAKVQFTAEEMKQLCEELEAIKIYGDRKDSDIAKLNPYVKYKGDGKQE